MIKFLIILYCRSKIKFQICQRDIYQPLREGAVAEAFLSATPSNRNKLNLSTMKKIMLKSVVVALAGTMLFTSCIGSFSLFNKLAEWNTQATGNKYLNAIIGVVISPAYGICLFADWWVLNSIEFWTGEQVLADVGKTQPLVGRDGDFYLITTVVDGYSISNETKKQTSFLKFDKESNVWSYESEGQVSKLLRVNADNTLTVFLPNGDTMDVTNDAQGLQQVKAALNPTIPFMAAN
jgi:hypothetical protein